MNCNLEITSNRYIAKKERKYDELKKEIMTINP